MLDAGCGEGYNGRVLARRGARVTGIDISERMIELARAEERREPLGIRYERASYADFGAIPDASFDAVVSFMALMDGPRFDLAMRESFRVLRRGGMLAFSITHPCFITKGSRWLRDEHGAKVKWMVSEYWNPAGWVEQWRFTDASARRARLRLAAIRSHAVRVRQRHHRGGTRPRGSRSRARRRSTARRIPASGDGGITPRCS